MVHLIHGSIRKTRSPLYGRLVVQYMAALGRLVVHYKEDLQSVRLLGERLVVH